MKKEYSYEEQIDIIVKFYEYVDPSKTIDERKGIIDRRRNQGDKKGTPIHVKGALIYNYQIKQFGLEKKYPLIQEGDKIKFVKLLEANPFKFDVISYVTELPKEFKLKEYVDYELQFEKTLLDPIRFILQPIGWTPEPKASLEAFFG